MAPRPQPRLKNQSSKVQPTTASAIALRATRALNPGLPDMPRPVRSSAEVQQEKNAKAQQKQQKEDKQREGISQAAAFSNRLVLEDSVRDQNANHPPSSELEKVLRPQLEKSTVDREPIWGWKIRNGSHTVYQSHIVADVNHAPSSLPENYHLCGIDVLLKATRPSEDGELSTLATSLGELAAGGDLFGSSDDYQPSEKPLSASDDEVMDASEEQAPKPIKTTGRTKKASKGSVRDAVDAERVKQRGSVADGKRKAPPVEQVILFCCEISGLIRRRSKSKKKQKKAPVGGIRVDWSRGRAPTTEVVYAPSRSRSATLGAISFVSNRRSASSDVDMAGLPGSDSSAIGGIPSDVDIHCGGDRECDIRSSQGIADTIAPGLVGPSARLQNPSGKIKKADIKLSDIPDPIRLQFKTKFTPPLLEFVGRLDGWDDPTTNDVIAIWNDTFTDYAVSTSDPRDHQLVLIIQNLAQDKIDGWRNKLGAAGEIIEDVENYLAGDDRSRVFYYRDVKGIFQNLGFSRVLAVHCLATAMVGQVGPLDLKLIPRTSAITAVVKKLKAEHWSKIIAAARAVAVQRDDAPAGAVIDVDADVSLGDFDLIDDDSDAQDVPGIFYPKGDITPIFC
ncbi:hypothetical protein MVEN_01135600 [Mycena venus]|uniref:Uncharacterized protein n=1 Tax=Mycena venus TaxID=2733690 RepID=A0A8H6Y8P6_9AGAR|nr:hypothetical protein MVEN_01135600 [Mycena venus]